MRLGENITFSQRYYISYLAGATVLEYYAVCTHTQYTLHAM